MTQAPTNTPELPDEIFLERMFLCQGAEPMTYGTVYAGISDLEKSDLEKYVRANLSPAKAVGGDSELLREARNWIECSEAVAKDEAEKVGQKLPAARLRIYQTIRAALTPESEGIAGKGDVCPDCGSEMAMECQGLSVRAGTNGCNSPARPQEIDVEQLKREVFTETNKVATSCRYVGKYSVGVIIDHLAASGYLSAPSPDLEKVRSILTALSKCNDKPFWRLNGKSAWDVLDNVAARATEALALLTKSGR